MPHRERTPDEWEDEHATLVPEVDPSSTREADDTQVDRIAADLLATVDPLDTMHDGDRAPACSTVRYDALVRGDQIGDFRIQRLLGRGSFGAVYLARDLTLDRLVALKVVLPEGQRATAGEGRSLARLKHRGIVGVYGEAHDPRSGCSLLWMQFVDGCNLATVIDRLHQRRGSWNETDLLNCLSPDRAPLSDPGLDVRRATECVCRIGRELAEAVSHAHDSGVTHRDIKPANVLMQRDGTPLLADFNLAENAHDGEQENSSGGTIAYMPPEQLAKVLGDDVTYDPRRADVYSLGVVLWELACGRRPHQDSESALESRGVARLRDFLRLRQQQSPPSHADVPVGLASVLRRAMSAEPEKRYPSAAAMATALSGLAELQRARRRAPVAPGWLQFAREHLFWIILIAGILPHLAASVLQSRYNQIWIGSSGEAFTKAFIAYNIVVYPACVGWLAWNLYQFAKGYRRVVARQPVCRSEMRHLRGRLLRLPRQFTIASAFGWFPGIILFPWLLGVFGHAPSASDWFHYGISFAIAGLIATTYSYAIVLYVVVCQGYRACWQTATHYRQRARTELLGMQRRIGRVAVLAGVLPLAAAVLLLAMGTPSIEMMTLASDSDAGTVGRIQSQMHKVQDLHRLVIALIVAGAIGLYVVQVASARLIRVVRALTLSDD